MTLIAAFRCYEGAVLCADSQETVDVPGYGQYRVRVNKLEPQTAGGYQVVVGGSGDGDLVDAFTTALIEAVAEWPRFDDELSTRRAIKRILIEFYREDVAASHATEDDKRLSFLICLKHNDDGNISLWRASGVSVKRAGDVELLGWEEPIFWHEAARLYQPNTISNHAMLLGVHLFSIAKQTSNVISGDTKVILARDNGIHVIPASDVRELEGMLGTFNKMVDELRLILPNMSIPLDEFRGYVRSFSDSVISQHERYVGRYAVTTLIRSASDPNYRGEPMPPCPPGTFLVVSEDMTIMSDGSLIPKRLTQPDRKADTPDSQESEKK